MSDSINLTISNWVSACQYFEKRGEAYCLATLIAKAGSAPATVGAKMVVSQTHQFDTLGGGNLEHQVIEIARKGLKATDPQVSVNRFTLSEDSGQHCGGAVQIMFEYRNVQHPKVVIFGAGHVCQALCSILKELPCAITVIDTRKKWLEPLESQGIQTSLQSNPVSILPTLPVDAYLLVMTQSHELDQDIVHHALEHQGFSFIGLIGSASKKHYIEQELSKKLSDTSLLQQLTCPIGRADIPGKMPMEIAVSVSAQLMELFAEKSSANPVKDTELWVMANELRKMLKENG